MICTVVSVTSFMVWFFCRRDEAIRVWRNWLREDPLVHPYKWLKPDLVPPAPFLQCQPHLTPGGSGVLADLAMILLLPFGAKGYQP